MATVGVTVSIYTNVGRISGSFGKRRLRRQALYSCDEFDGIANDFLPSENLFRNLNDCPNSENRPIIDCQ